MFKEFKTFIMRGNMLDMAVGVILGTAFGKIIDTMVTDLIMPPLGLLIGSTDFSDIIVVLKDGTPPAPYVNTAQAKAAGAVVMSPGVFINTLMSFLIVAAAMFCLVKFINKIYTVSERAMNVAADKMAHNAYTSKIHSLTKTDQQNQQKPIETALQPNGYIPVETKVCPYCFSTINIKAVKCPFCTSDLEQNT